MFLRNLLLSNLSTLLFLSLSKELIINCPNKNIDKARDTSKKTSFEILENASLR